MVMIALIIVAATAYALSVFYGYKLYHRYFEKAFWDRLLLAITPFLSTEAVLYMISKVLTIPFHDWSNCRLAPTISLLYGYNLYYTTDGPLTNMIYGPVTAFAYLPSAIASTPTGALTIAGFISVFMYFGPVALLLWLFCKDDRKKLFYGLISFLLFFFLTILHEGMILSAFTVHSDSIALGLSMTACVFLLARKDSHKKLLMTLLSALFVTLSIWTKQTLVPIIFTLPLFVLLSEGVKEFVKYTIILTIVGLTVSALFFGFMDIDAWYLNAILVPAKHPWNKSVVKMIKLLLIYILPFGLVFLTYLKLFLVAKTGLPERLGIIRQYIKLIVVEPWFLLIVNAAFLFPLSILGVVKQGGMETSFSLCAYYLMAGAALLASDMTAKNMDMHLDILNSITKSFTVIFLTVFFLVADPLFRNLAVLKDFERNPSQIAYEFSRQNPGKAYFPYHILSTLMAEGKLYHFDHALIDRYFAGMSLSREQFMKYIPQNMDYLIYPANNCTLYAQTNYLKDFTKKIDSNELQGLRVFVKENEGK
ncbi:MAG: hypothetical protein Kow0090_05620 [Myxococcota bacterium]